MPVGYQTLKTIFDLMEDVYPQEVGPTYVSEILSGSPQKAYEGLKTLCNRGLVEKIKRGKYRLTGKDFKSTQKFYNQSVSYPYEIWNYHKWCVHLVKAVRTRKRNGKPINIFCDIDADFLVALWEKQDGRCTVSNIPMTTIRGNGWQVPTNASVDQIKAGHGYTKENSRLVCWQVNLMKGQLTDDELFLFCKMIFETYEEKNGRG